jgi:DNA adenine methylase
MTSPSRPVLRWHGGKWLLAPWIISHFPRHRIYVEPFGGAASVLLRKKTVFSEIYNDLDGEVVSLFRVLRNREQAAELVRLLELTPFAREEFDLSYEATDCLIERARRLIVRSYMGFGSDSAHTSGTTGFRAQSPQSCRSPEKDWRNYPAKLSATIERLRDVVIENRPATEIMSRHDSDETLHYVDPPYLPETRSKKSRKGGASYHSYRFELTTDDHTDLLSYLRGLKGMVVLSGYPSTLYDDALAGWHRIEKNAFADGAAKRVEVLWLNPVCFERLQRRALPLLHHLEAAE